MTSKVLKTLCLVMVAMFVIGAPAFASTPAEGETVVESPVKWAYLAAGLGAGLATIGGAYGIGKIAAAAMDGTSRQPEAGGMIRVSMIIAAALIEGFTFFAMIICIIMANKS